MSHFENKYARNDNFNSETYLVNLLMTASINCENKIQYHSNDKEACKQV